jgi:hypothetical protein
MAEKPTPNRIEDPEVRDASIIKHKRQKLLIDGVQDTLPVALQDVDADVVEMLRAKLHTVIDGSIRNSEIWDFSKGQRDFLVQWVLYCVENNHHCSSTLAAGALHILREVHGVIADVDENLLRRTIKALEANTAITEGADAIKRYITKTRQALFDAEREATAKQVAQDAMRVSKEVLPDKKPGMQQLSETVQRIRSAMILQNYSRAAEIARTTLHESSNDIPTLIACATALQNHGMDPSIKNPFARLADVIKAIETFEHALLLLETKKNPKTEQMIQQSLAKLKAAREKLEEDTKRKKP